MPPRFTPVEDLKCPLDFATKIGNEFGNCFYN